MQGEENSCDVFEDVDSMIGEVQENIDMQKDMMKEKFLEIKEQRTKIITSMKQNFNYLFDLKQIFKMLKQYKKKDVTIEVF